MVVEAVGLEKANVQLGRYFSPNLVPKLVASPDLFKVGGERRELSFVFSDLQGFTALVETLEPDVVVPLINRYLNALVEVAFKHQGTVDKIVGDAVHIIFGAPEEQPDHARRAVACALEMDAVAEGLRAEVAPNIALGCTRIGVNSGDVIEQADGTIYGWDRAVQRLRDLEVSDVQAVVDHMADDLWEHLGDTPLPDDITIIALRVEP